MVAQHSMWLSLRHSALCCPPARPLAPTAAGGGPARRAPALGHWRRLQDRRGGSSHSMQRQRFGANQLDKQRVRVACTTASEPPALRPLIVARPTFFLAALVVFLAVGSDLFMPWGSQWLLVGTLLTQTLSSAPCALDNMDAAGLTASNGAWIYLNYWSFMHLSGLKSLSASLTGQHRLARAALGHHARLQVSTRLCF